MVGYIPTIPDAPVGEWDPTGALILGLLAVLAIVYLIRAGTPGTRH